jgi:GNAT superfamily N-acetyltransferase
MEKLELITRLATEEDLPEMLHLFAKAMRGYVAYPYRLFWQWKHEQNLFGKSPVLLAIHDEKIVGIRAFMRWQLLHKGETLQAFRAVDTVTDPEYQGRGIFKTLTLELIEQLKHSEADCFIFNTPNKQSMPGYLKMGWQVLGKAPVYVRPVLFRKPFQQEVWMHYRQQLQNFSTITGSETYNGTSLIHVPKSADYLNWRYGAYPVPDYALDVVKDGSKELYFFFKVKQHRYFRELRVCDVWSKEEKDLRFIAGHATQLAKRIGCHFASVMPEPGYGGSLLRHGYFSVRQLANVITIRDINSDRFGVNSVFENWSFRMGDLELF